MKKKILKNMFIGLLCSGLLLSYLSFENIRDVDASETVSVQNEAPPFRSVMYYGDWTTGSAHGYFYPKDIPAELLTHLNFAFLYFDVQGNLRWSDEFAALATPGGEATVVEGSASAGLLNAFQELRLRNPNLRIGVSVGGWTLSGNFAPNAQNDEYRQRLVANLLSFVEYNEMDFLDIDWEYPGDFRLPDVVDSVRDQGNPYASPADTENFNTLLRELRVGIDALSERVGRPLELSVALPASGWGARYIDVATVFELVDFANLMHYDMHGTWETQSNHHTGLFANPNAPLDQWGGSSQFSIEASVNWYLDQGVDPSQIVIGAAFYSRGWGNVANDGFDPVGHPGLFGTADFGPIDADGSPSRGATNEFPLIDGEGGRHAGIWSYRFLYRLRELYPDLVEHWDDYAKAPFLFGEESGVFISFENERSVTYKAQFVRDRHLGGIISWMQSQDAPTDPDSNRRDRLTTAIFNGLFGEGTVLPQREIVTATLDVVADVEPLRDGREGYIVTLTNHEVLSATDAVLQQVERNHRTVKNPVIYLPVTIDETLTLDGAMEASTIFGDEHRLDLTAIGLREIAPGESVTFIVLTDALYADSNRISEISFTQRIVTEEFGRQRIYELEAPIRESGRVTLNFLNEAGEALQEAIQLEGMIGSTFEFAVPQIEGYTLQGLSTISGVFRYAQQSFDFIYQQDTVIVPTDPTDVIDPTDPTVPTDATDATDPPQPTAPTTPHDNRLPQTGAVITATALTGSALIATGVLTTVVKKMKR
ncbi:MAG: glycosyl hydrolase family 18 protein [Defluviitaleaceae bacterium]|nr:glycosyl hydrolase family 18 protein [Defluviitaleaceae bacterium]